MATWIGQLETSDKILVDTQMNMHMYIWIPIHQEEESLFPFGILLISLSAAADQVSSFRVACAVDRILSRNKLKLF